MLAECSIIIVVFGVSREECKMSNAKMLGVPLTVVGHLDRIGANSCNDGASHAITSTLPNESFMARLRAENPSVKGDLDLLEGKDVVVVGVPALSGSPECHYINVYLVFDLATKSSFIDTQSVRSVEIGRIKTHRESKLEWPGPTLRCRDHYVCEYADINVPDNLADAAWRKLVNCALGAGIAAGVAAIIASPVAALPVFESVFVPCITQELGNLASGISVGLHTNEATAAWGPC